MLVNMEPTSKSPAIDGVIRTTFKIDRVASIRSNTCVFCKKTIDPDTEFRDALSRKEFTISGICQKCQDETFGS